MSKFNIATVPFAAHTGVKLETVGSGTATATLEQTHNSSNHIKSQHAGVTLAEAVNGDMMWIKSLTAMRFALVGLDPLGRAARDVAKGGFR